MKSTEARTVSRSAVIVAVAVLWALLAPLHQAIAAGAGQGVVMLETPLSDWTEILSWVDRDDAYDSYSGEHRFEKWPHITVLYGLYPDAEERVLSFLRNLRGPLSYRIIDVSVFEGKYRDVLKFGIESPVLEALHRALRRFPNSWSYPEYGPHMTIARINKGCAAKYVRALTNPPRLFGIKLVYRLANGEDVQIPLVNAGRPGFALAGAGSREPAPDPSAPVSGPLVHELISGPGTNSEEEKGNPDASGTIRVVGSGGVRSF